MKLPRLLQTERLTPVRVLAGGVASLIIAIASVAYGHLAASPIAPWFSIAFSAAAIALTVIAVVLPSRR